MHNFTMRGLTIILFFCICISEIINGLQVKTIPPVISLPRYNVRHDAVTLSGFSAGSSMATQFHVAHSGLFHGVALFSQAFYRCGPHSLIEFGLRCSKLGMGVFPYNVRLAIEDARRYEWLRLIDPLRNLLHQRVFIWTGALDEYVPPDMAMDNAKFYGTFISDKMSLINATLFHATHLMPTTNFGDACDQSADHNEYLGNCNYSGAYNALEFLLRDKSNLINPFAIKENQNVSYEGSLMAYNQSEFHTGNDIKEAAMGTMGFIYVPTQCQPEFNSTNKPCFLHLNFHGCNEWPPQVALQYIKNSGFLPVADANGIIIVFPLSTKVPQNMNGCWDFFSYTGPLFATKKGKQIKIAKAIVDRILGTV